MTDTPDRAPTERDRPWIFRTYSGHSTATESNRLYRGNLAKGQTGLSIAFDLPTQTGYDSDHALARGEVGKVGVPISHLGDMTALLDGIPLETMNTSMTINATAAWLLALYVAAAEQQGADRPSSRARRRTTSSRNTCRAAPTFSARAVDAADQRRHRLDLPGDAEVEPDQRLLLPSAGGRRDAGAGAGLRAGQRHRRSRQRARRRAQSPRRVSAARRAHLVLRQRRHPLRHRDVQDARVDRAVGRDHGGALRHRGSRSSPLPLWRAGQLAGADRSSSRRTT